MFPYNMVVYPSGFPSFHTINLEQHTRLQVQDLMDSAEVAKLSCALKSWPIDHLALLSEEEPIVWKELCT